MRVEADVVEVVMGENEVGKLMAAAERASLESVADANRAALDAANNNVWKRRRGRSSVPWRVGGRWRS
jgi:hypothetical protein